MQSVSIRDTLHEMSNPVFWKKNKKDITNVLSSELAERVVKINGFISIKNRHLLIQERLNKLIYSINKIIKCGI